MIEMSKGFRSAAARSAARWDLSYDGSGMAPRIPIVEELRRENIRTRHPGWIVLGILRLRDAWSFCLSMEDSSGGVGWGPVVTHCPPHASRNEALLAARGYIYARTDDRGIRNWIDGLLQGVQEDLFKDGFRSG